MPSTEREQGEAGSGVGRAAEVRGHEPGVQHHVSSARYLIARKTTTAMWLSLRGAAFARLAAGIRNLNMGQENPEIECERGLKNNKALTYGHERALGRTEAKKNSIHFGHLA